MVADLVVKLAAQSAGMMVVALAAEKVEKKASPMVDKSAASTADKKEYSRAG